MEDNRDKMKEIMEMAKLEMPFKDFDSIVMARINKLEADKQSISKTRKYALLSFIFGAFSGIGLNYILSEFISTHILDPLTKNYLSILSQVVYVVLLVILIDKILKLRQYKNMNKSIR